VPRRAPWRPAPSTSASAACSHKAHSGAVDIQTRARVSPRPRAVVVIARARCCRFRGGPGSMSGSCSQDSRVRRKNVCTARRDRLRARRCAVASRRGRKRVEGTAAEQGAGGVTVSRLGADSACKFHAGAGCRVPCHSCHRHAAAP
jgi:hypothetical protein